MWNKFFELCSATGLVLSSIAIAFDLPEIPASEIDMADIQGWFRIAIFVGCTALFLGFVRLWLFFGSPLMRQNEQKYIVTFVLLLLARFLLFIVGPKMLTPDGNTIASASFITLFLFLAAFFLNHRITVWRKRVNRERLKDVYDAIDNMILDMKARSV